MLPLLALMIACAAVFLFARPLAVRIERFYADYPLVRLAPSSQLRLKPAYLRAAAVIVAVTVWVASALR